MKMHSANAAPWFGNLPAIVARVFAHRSSKNRRRAICDSNKTSAAGKPGPLPNASGIAPKIPQEPSSRRPEIMVPVDFSPESMQAADYATRFARRMEGRLILLHAIHLNLTPYGPANPTWLRAALCREALEKMEATMGRAQRLGVPVISVIEEG